MDLWKYVPSDDNLRLIVAFSVVIGIILIVAGALQHSGML